MRRLTRNLLIAFAAVAAFYIIGGATALRWARARWRASLQPPTADQMRLPADTVVPLRASLTPEMAHGRMWLSEPPSRPAMALGLTTIVIATVLAMYVTGRAQRT